MFNLLVDKLPTAARIGGTTYQINYTADALLRISILAEEHTASEEAEEAYYQLAAQQMKIFYPVIPTDLEAALTYMMEFYTYSVITTTQVSSKASSNRDMAFSYKHDSNLIYAAFAKQYPNKDIAALHWFVFKALFEGLTEEALFVKVMQYRTIKISSKMSKEEKSFYSKMKRLWALPDDRPAEEKDADFASMLYYM